MGIRQQRFLSLIICLSACSLYVVWKGTLEQQEMELQQLERDKKAFSQRLSRDPEFVRSVPVLILYCVVEMT